MAAPSYRSTVTLYSASGTPYAFSLYTRREPPPSHCAVYTVLRETPTGYLVLYIGETESCQQRFGGHHKEYCFTARGATHLGVLYESSHVRRLAIERDLIARYTPPCND